MGTQAVKKMGYSFWVFICIIIVVITCISALSPYHDPTDWSVVTYLGLALPMLLIVNVILIIYWAFKKSLWVLIHIVAICANWGYISAVVHFNGSQEVQTNDIRIATYNVNNFQDEYTGFYAKKIASMLNDSADIVCMQEFVPMSKFGIDSIVDAFSNLKYSYIPTKNERTRVALFSRYPIIRTHFIPYKNSNNCSLWCDVNINGKCVRVFNNHLQTTDMTRVQHNYNKNKVYADNAEEVALKSLKTGIKENFKIRAMQAKVIRSMIDTTKCAVIVCGDFNSTPSSFTYHHILGDDLNDSFKTCGNGYEFTYQSLLSLLRIDYIMYSNDFIGIKHEALSRKWSDHKPVFTTLRFK